jgi:CarboxypepD_reg-like domain
MQKKLYLILINSLLNLTSFCQHTIVIKDSASKKPLQFATVESLIKKWGKYTDSTGSVSIMDSIWKTGEIACSYVGYTTKVVVLKQETNEILLSKKEQVLNDILVTPCKEFKEQKLAIRNKKSNYSFGYSAASNGFIWATFVPNNTGKFGFIKSISFASKKHYNAAIIETPIRIRFFSLDSVTQLPEEEITTESIILTPNEKGWNAFDISTYKISVPENGIVVAFEMFDAGPQYHFKATNKMTDGTTRNFEGYGFSLYGITDEGIMGFRRFFGGDWVSFKSLFEKNPAAPQVELNVQFCDK